jgi:hypothetical protein
MFRKAIALLLLSCALMTACDMRMYKARKAKKSKAMRAAMAKKKKSQNFFQEKSPNPKGEAMAQKKKEEKISEKNQKITQDNLKKLNEKKANTAIEKHEGRFNFY